MAATGQDGATRLVDDLELRPRGTRTAADEPEIFHEHEAPAAWPRRFAVVGVMAALLAAVFFGWSAMRSAPAGAGQADTAAARAGDQPLELLSLQYAQGDGLLVISGLVQNPRNGKALSGVEATVQLFGADGGMLTSGRSPLDFALLSPGGESPFAIRVPVSGTVARYRVGFRGANDRVLGHVDRRNPDALARRQAP